MLIASRTRTQRGKEIISSKPGLRWPAQIVSCPLFSGRWLPVFSLS